MGISFRHYLFFADSVLFLPTRLMTGLAHGEDAMPKYAGQRLRYASVVVDNDNGVPRAILEITGRYLDFDDDGKIHEVMMKNFAELMTLADAAEREGRIVPCKVAMALPVRRNSRHPQRSPRRSGMILTQGRAISTDRATAIAAY